MDPSEIVCPVCTLFLRPGITLKQHLSSHPKQKVIEALVKLAGVEDSLKIPNVPSQSVASTSGSSQVNTAVTTQPWSHHPPPGQVNPIPSTPAQINPMQGNHVFIYQQSMSTAPQPNVLNVNPLSQQYMYPAVFNPQMIPYVYQQQQVIMSSNSLPSPIRALPSSIPSSLPFDLSNSAQANENNRDQQDGNERSNQNEVDNRIIELHDNVSQSTTSEICENIEQEKENDSIADIVIKKQEIIEIVNEEISSDVKTMTEVKITGDVKTMEDFEHQQLVLNEIPPEAYETEARDNYSSPHDSEVDEEQPPIHYHENRDSLETEEKLISPKSHSEWRIQQSESDLNKACQTQNTHNISSPISPVEVEANDLQHENVEEEDHPEYFYVQNEDHYVEPQVSVYNQGNIPFTTVKISTESYEQSEPIYTSANILHGGDHLDLVSLDDVIIINGYSANQVITQVDNFESSPERSGILMTIGDIPCHQKVEFNEQRDLDESVSRGSSHVNIRSDERMPPRGELSGQESIDGASDITWNRLQYQEGSSKMSQYDLLGRDTWETSDSDSVDNPAIDGDMPILKPYDQDLNDGENENDSPKIISYSGPPLNFKCPTCGGDFATSKERKEHEIKEHPEKSKNKLIGADIGKKKVKKLIVKFKSDKPETENNFDNVFTNKLKLETSSEAPPPILLTENVIVDSNPIDVKDLKTVCTICDCLFENAKVLKEHKEETHKDIFPLRHKCATCGESFSNEYKYTAHLKIHPLECRLCGKLFYRRQNIQLHMKRHLGLKPYKCEVCQKCFVTRQKHDEHKNVHTGDTPLKCNLCDEKFRRHSNLVQHRNRHHFQLKKKIKDYICHCGEIFHSKKKLAWHKEVHDSKPKACTQCNEKFLHRSSLTRHMRRAHNEKYLPEENRQNENVECPICKGTYLKSSLEVHIRNHSGQRPYTCLICNKDFTTKWNLKLHKWTHASRTSKPYKCDQCKGAFIRESDYTAHMNSHKSVRPYTCNYCGAQFIRKYNCLRHVKEHENEKTYNCSVCGKSFHRSYYLKDHMRVHSGVRPYTCHICGKTSTTKSNHNKHIQIHHAREPVSTEN